MVKGSDWSAKDLSADATAAESDPRAACWMWEYLDGLRGQAGEEQGKDDVTQHVFPLLSVKGEVWHAVEEKSTLGFMCPILPIRQVTFKRDVFVN